MPDRVPDSQTGKSGRHSLYTILVRQGLLGLESSDAVPARRRTHLGTCGLYRIVGNEFVAVLIV